MATKNYNYWRPHLLNMTDDELFKAGVYYKEKIEDVTHWKLWYIKFPVIIKLGTKGVWFSSQVDCVMCQQTPLVMGSLVRFINPPNVSCFYDLPDIVTKAKESLKEVWINVTNHSEAWVELEGSKGNYIVTWENCD